MVKVKKAYTKWILRRTYFIRYLFHKADEPYWCSNNRLIDFCRRFWCRLRNHPAGPIYYNSNGWEPDDRCKNCGDHLG